MLLAHAITLAQARSHVAALADTAGTFDASVEYENVLLQLDGIHGDDIPGISPVLDDRSEEVFLVAEAAIEALVVHGVDALDVELLLDVLQRARALDVP